VGRGEDPETRSATMTTTYDRTYLDAEGYEHRYAAHEHDAGEEVECAYCGITVPGCPDCPNAPPADDDDAWAELAEHHADGCEWIATRAHRID
jgi:hypothetical protein